MTNNDPSNDPSAYSAPTEVRFCSCCGAPMATRDVAGKPRRACTDQECGYVHFVESKLGVGVLVIHNDRLLLVKRGKPPEVGKWSLPAGYVDTAEDPIAVAARETREETALTIQVTELLGVYHNPPGQGGASVFILYRAEIHGDSEPHAGDDADDAHFFALDALPELAFRSTRDAVARLLSDNPALRD